MNIKKKNWKQYEYLEIGPDNKQVILMLHGRGGDASDILNLARHFYSENIHYIALTANENQWYPKPFTYPREHNQPYLNQHLNDLLKLIHTLNEKYNKKISIVGFSQGACMALELGIKAYDLIENVVAFSGGLIGTDEEIKINDVKLQKQSIKPNIYISGSETDPFIPLKRMQQSEKELKQCGYKLELNTYPGNTHHINQDELNLLKKLFINK